MKQKTLRRYHRQTEAGNVVALTLLGLAAAILAGVAVLVLVGYKTQQPAPTLTEASTTPADETTPEADPYDGWATYESKEFHFSVRYPEGWAVDEGSVDGTPFVVLYDARSVVAGTSSAPAVSKAETADNIVSIRPRGPQVVVSGETVAASKVILSIGGASAQDLVLEGTSQPWATIVRFETYPSSWNSSSTIFARSLVAEEEVEYRRGAEVISSESYDPLAGDKIKRFGFVDPAARALVERIVLSFRFVDDDSLSPTHATSSETTVDTQERTDITITEPLAGTSVTSPLVVRGVASAEWFDESSPFSVVLTDLSGKTITIADVRTDTASGGDRSESIPFIGTLSFDPGVATSGKLVFSSGTGTGTALTYDIPIAFESKEE